MSAPLEIPLSGDPIQLRPGPISMPRQLSVALLRAPSRPAGVLKDREALRPIVARRDGVVIGEERAGRYRQVCGFPDRQGAVPSTLPEILFHDLMVSIALAPAFPFRAMGLIHLRQSIHQRRPILSQTPLDLTCRLARVLETSRGYELDCTMQAVDEEGLAWEGVATLLSRAPRSTAGKRSRRPAHEGEPVAGGEEIVAVPADMGRRYAAVSGDYNPHHLYPLTARLFGFSRPIAHGMWTLARTLAFLDAQRELPPTHRLEAAFKRPVLMPGELALRSEEAEGRRDFLVRNPQKRVPHLVGRVRES